jgi:Bacterial regulatory proteins, luxR family
VADWHTTALAERNRFEGRADPAAWAAAAAAWERFGRPYRVAYAGFRQAEALMAVDGDRDAAAEALRRAAAITTRLGARPLDAEVKAPAQRARLRLDPDVTPPATAAPTPTEQLGLTPREAEVLALVAAGRSNRQIAQRCSSAPRRPASTSPTSWPSSASPPGSRPPPSPTASAWTECAPGWPVKIRRAGQVI